MLINLYNAATGEYVGPTARERTKDRRYALMYSVSGESGMNVPAGFDPISIHARPPVPVSTAQSFQITVKDVNAVFVVFTVYTVWDEDGDPVPAGKVRVVFEDCAYVTDRDTFVTDLRDLATKLEAVRDS